MPRFASLVLVAVLVAAAAGQETKWQPPAVPDGWKAVTSKDDRYRFAVPKEAKGTSTRDRTMTARGFRAQVQIHATTLKDGTILQVGAATLTGADLKGQTVDQLIDTIVGLFKEDGFKISEPKEVKVGDQKAREWRLTGDKESHRLVAFGAKPRIYLIEVIGADAKQLDTETANTFVNSFVLVPPEVVKALAAERAAKAEAAAKEAKEKFGFAWTDNPKDMTVPDAPVTGLVRGKEFKPDTVQLQPGGTLKFRIGTATFSEAEVNLWVNLKPGESIEGRTYDVGKGIKSDVVPVVRIATMPAGAKVPRTESFLDKYTMKLSFGKKDADGSIPGTIYLCTPDAAKSFIAGKFKATEK